MSPGCRCAHPRLWYLNGGFDLALAGADPGRFKDQLDEMTLWYLLAAAGDDRVVLDIPAPAPWLEYCRSAGLEIPGAAAAAKDNRGLQGRAWGWDAAAVERLGPLGAALRHPPLRAVARANSRSFAHEVAAANGYGVAGSRLCRNAAELERTLGEFGSRPLVIKPNHGNAGVGFLFVNVPDRSAPADGQLAALFARAEACVVVEPWLARAADLSTHFLLGADGSIAALRHYQTLVTASGAFYGIACTDANPLAQRWQGPLDAVARVVAHALHREGYFGPVSIDSLVTTRAGEPELVPLLEINARDSMSFVAFSLRERLAAGRHCLMRTAGRRQHRLPDSYDTWRSLLGTDAYDPARGRGVLCATPLRLAAPASAPRQPARSIFFLAADSPQDLAQIDRRLSAAIHC